jgi:serine phosphatase RsbU (regulator of sigma subunit)
MPWLEAASLLACGLLLIGVLPGLRLRYALLIGGGLVGGLFALGLGLFQWRGWLFDALVPGLGLTLVFASLIASGLIEARRQQQAAERALQAQREAAARVAGELEAARRIQLGSLPVAAYAFPGESRFEIDALLEPAREVGGDLYDFFMLDANRLFFVVGDVSGKGLPASLFMAVAKALSKSAALRRESGVEEIVSTANIELSRENPEMLFVTLVAGILDVSNGALQLCNAGHDAPFVTAPDGSVHRLDGDGGPPLCVLDDFPYPVMHHQLAAGETLCLITDGVSEAMNAAAELYGCERLVVCLEGGHHSASEVLQAVREDVRSFVLEAEASDDLTLVTLRWLGAAPSGE